MVAHRGVDGKTFDGLEISEQACEAIERRTRKQAQSPNWFDYRACQITASTVYDVCALSLSLVKRICAPQGMNILLAPPIRYSQEHEEDALKKY